MKKLDVSSITDTSQFPLKQGTLQFLQDANAEVLANILIGLIGPGYNPATIYVLNGCVNSGTGTVYIITAGAVFYNGEVFLVAATSFTVSGGNVPIFTQVTSQYTVHADPVTFTDAVVRNVHNIRMFAIVQGASGSGVADYSQGYFLSFAIPLQLNLTAPNTGSYATNILQLIGVYPNMALYVPAPASGANPILYAGSYNVGDLQDPGLDYAITFPAALATASYYIMGTLISNGVDANNDSTGVWTVRARTTTGFTLHVNEYAHSILQNLAFEYIIFQK